MVAANPRQVVEGVAIVLVSVAAIPRLEQTHDVFRTICPPPGGGKLVFDVLSQALILFQDARLSQVTGQQVVERGDIGAALYGRMPTQREYAATWPAHVA